MAHNVANSKLITAILTAATVREAAELAGVSERTLWRRLAEQDFRAELQEAEAAALDQACRRLAGGIGAALDTLQDVMHGDAPAGVKVSAARAWLEAALKWVELRSIIVRLDRLEAAQNGGTR